MTEFSKQTLSPGDGKTYPKKGDTVVMEYTGSFLSTDGWFEVDWYEGWIHDESAPQKRGKQYVPDSDFWSIILIVIRFDSSVGRADFETAIGIGRVIQGKSGEQTLNACWHQEGWDKGVVQMSVGEKAILTIPSWVPLHILHRTQANLIQGHGLWSKVRFTPSRAT